MKTVKLRVTAKENVERRFAVIVLDQKVAVAFDRDSGAKVGYGTRMISGEIGSGGSRKNWYCYVSAGTIFEIEVDEELYNKNKNRIKKWDIEEIEEFTISEERARMLQEAIIE
jgi:hypothetical protein